MATRRRAPKRSGGKRTVRAQILAVLGREREVYNRKTREYDRRAPTMAEAAKDIGVSVSTLRRWKNQGVTPRQETRRERARIERLKKAAQHAERATSRELARDRKKHPDALKITKKDLPALPVGHRRNLKKYARDESGQVRATGEEYESSITNYNVRGWTFREIAALVLQAWRAKKPFQFIYEVPAGGSLPKSGRAKERKVNKLTRAGTAPIDPYGLQDEAEVLNVLNRYIDIEAGMYSRRMIYIAIDDNYPGPRPDEGDEE